jgi:inosose dehydratase
MDMTTRLDRRTFCKTLSTAAAGIPTLQATPHRRLKIGYTCITWGTFPKKGTPDETLEPALKDISSLGFWGFETFPEVLADWDAKGALAPMIARYGVPLKSGYCGTNLTDPTKRKESLENVKKLGKMITKYGGTFGVLAPNGVKRESYDFKEYKTGIISGLNDHAMALTDLGLTAGLHQHTGTCIESREEVYAVMEGVNTKYMKFAPDVGQLQKGGADAAKVVHDFLPLVMHMHLKDYNGGDYFSGYCPLGQGKVDIAGILNMLEEGGNHLDVMIELDPSANAPITPLKTAQISKAYLEKLGYTFRKPRSS